MELRLSRTSSVGLKRDGKYSDRGHLEQTKDSDYTFPPRAETGGVVAGDTTFTVADAWLIEVPRKPSLAWIPAQTNGAPPWYRRRHRDFETGRTRSRPGCDRADCGQVVSDRPGWCAEQADVRKAGSWRRWSPDLEARGLPVFIISTKTGQGLQALTFAMAELVVARRRDAPAPASARIVIRPEPTVGADFTIRRQGDGDGGWVWRVRGVKPERWVRQTDLETLRRWNLADRSTAGDRDPSARVGRPRWDAGGSVGTSGYFDFARSRHWRGLLDARRLYRLDTERPAVRGGELAMRIPAAYADEADSRESTPTRTCIAAMQPSPARAKRRRGLLIDRADAWASGSARGDASW